MDLKQIYKSRQAALNALSGNMAIITNGLFHDEYWTPITQLRNFLCGVDFVTDMVLGSGQYFHDKNGIVPPSTPVGKKWTWKVFFETKNGKDEKKIHEAWLHITASGAGRIEDPLESYDVVAYFS